MRVKGNNGTSRREKEVTFWAADVSQLYRMYGMELTGLKCPKTIGFRETV